MNTLRRFDRYLHAIGIEHSHEFIAGGELIVRKNQPDKESPHIKTLEKGFQKFQKSSDPFERCVKE